MGIQGTIRLSPESGDVMQVTLKHDQGKQNLRLAWIAIGILGICAGPIRAEDIADPKVASENRLRRDITYLASDECQGRGPGTDGIDRAGNYIANSFKVSGLKPLGPNNSYFQPFTIPSSILDGEPHLVLKGPNGQELTLKRGTDYEPLGLAGPGTLQDVPLVFAGFGLSSEPAGYDDFADLDVKGKLLIILRDVPKFEKAGLQEKLRGQSSLTEKLGRAKLKGAAGVLLVNTATAAKTADEMLPFEFTTLSAGKVEDRVPGLLLQRTVLDKILKSSDVSLEDVEKKIIAESKPQSRLLKDWKANLKVAMRSGTLQLRNVAGVLEGSGPLADQTVVIGAHYDHLGDGRGGGSLAGLKKKAVHYGADDNGSGTTSVLELARRFGTQQNRQGRRLVFLLFSGEELGLLGSRHYCKEPLIPLEKTIAMVNLDMVGRLREDPDTKKNRLQVEGSNTAKMFDEMLEQFNKKYDFKMVKSATVPANSDHFSFYQKKLPVLFLWTGLHQDYHRPTDTADKINVPGMRQIVDLAQEVITQLATQEKTPEYLVVRTASGGGGTRPDGPRLGIMPAYDDQGDGILIENVSEGLPAAKAGLKAGDRLMSVAGKPVKNIQAYMQTMGSQKKGETIEVTITRNGKTETIKVKLD